MQLQAIDIANALQINRPETGDLAGVGLYRLLRLVAMEDILGSSVQAREVSCIGGFGHDSCGFDLHIHD